MEWIDINIPWCDSYGETKILYEEFILRNKDQANLQTFEQFRKEYKDNTFRGRGLNKPGILIEVEIKNEDDETTTIKQYLIGDINISGGVCNDCMYFKCNDIVLRYKVLYEQERNKRIPE